MRIHLYITGVPGQAPGRYPTLPPRGFQVQKSFSELFEKQGLFLIVFKRCANRFQAFLRSYLGVHWNPKIVILQGRGIKKQYLWFFHS